MERFQPTMKRWLRAYRLRPKATPGERSDDTRWRVRTDRVDKTGRVTVRHDGRLHHIGHGYEHAGTRVLMLIAGRNIRVVDAGSGELLRELVLGPTRDYQRLGRPPGPQQRPETLNLRIQSPFQRVVAPDCSGL